MNMKLMRVQFGPDDGAFVSVMMVPREIPEDEIVRQARLNITRDIGSRNRLMIEDDVSGEFGKPVVTEVGGLQGVTYIMEY